MVKRKMLVSVKKCIPCIFQSRVSHSLWSKDYLPFSTGWICTVTNYEAFICLLATEQHYREGGGGGIYNAIKGDQRNRTRARIFRKMLPIAYRVGTTCVQRSISDQNSGSVVLIVLVLLSIFSKKTLSSPSFLCSLHFGLAQLILGSNLYQRTKLGASYTFLQLVQLLRELLRFWSRAHKCSNRPIFTSPFSVSDWCNDQ